MCVRMLALLLVMVMSSLGGAATSGSLERWSEKRISEWYEKKPWLVGSNFAPSTAINQLEMWQEDTFDTATIDRELGWARELGFNSMRVFLHDIPWKQDREGFLERIHTFLDICEKNKIGVMFVFFDSVWDPSPKAGKQRDPKPHVHNSGWVQSPGKEYLASPERLDELKPYVQGVLREFADDPRVHIWDLHNEPDNPVPQYKDVELPNKPEAALVLLQKAFEWAREINPSQPLTSGVWIGNWSDPDKLSPTERFQLENSDIISFHSYGPLEEVKKCVENLRRYKRPIACTEYVARPMGSTFDPILGYFRVEKVAAYNWGFVQGKTQTIYPWDSWQKEYTAEPDPWFHDILRTDGTPYRSEEVEYIKQQTEQKEPVR